MAARRNNNALNETLAAIWQELLGAEPERAPDFTRAGGSSMDALDLQLQVAARLGKHLAFDALPDPLNFADLVRAVESAPLVAAPGAEVSPTEAPATATQRAQWLIERTGSGTSAYTVPILLRLADGTTMNALGAAIARLVELHPSLRTSIGLAGDDEDRLLQRVHPAGALFPLETRALGSFETSDVEALLAAMLEPLPSIVRPAPMRATALTINGELRGAMLLIHHAAIDEWSIRVLLEDLDLLLRGESPSPERLALAAASEPAFTNEDRAWWGEVLESIPPHAEFPSDHGDAVRRIIRRTIDAESVARLDSTCAARGVEAAPAIIQAVATSVALHVADSSGVVSIGVPMSLRNDARLDRTLGMFLNTVPIPVMTSDPDFDGAVQRTRQLMLEARRRRFVPFESIARDHAPRRTDGRTPWLDVMVGVVDRPLPATQAFDAEVLEMHDSAAPLLVIMRWCSDGSIDVVVHHQTERVGSTVAESIIDGALARLDAFARDASTMLASSITDSAETPEPETLVAIVERQAAANRDAIAVQSSDRVLSYGEIVSLGRKVAAALDAAGARPGDAIAIELDSSWEFPVAVLGVLQAGCAALPIGPDTPSARRNELRTLAGAHRSIDAAFVHAAESSAECNELPLIALESRCYLLFTSGSTGEPKGVQMHHGPIANLVAFEVRRNPLPLPTAMLAPLGFDVVFQEIFGTWARGGTLIPVPSATRKDPHALANFIEANSIGRLHSPPILLRSLSRVIAPKDSRLASLEEVISAGEALHIDDGFRAMARAAGGFALVNQYGPTETHVATSIDLGMDPSAWPERPSVGTPIDGVRVRVVGKEGGDVARGFEGELQIGGRGPALGYLHDDPAHHFTIEEDGRWYSTGDRARILGDGSIEYLGRRDDQVKVAGYRVELGEVEHALAALDGIAAAAVVAASIDGETVLRAFVILEQNHSFDHAAIDAALRLRLPSYLRLEQSTSVIDFRSPPTARSTGGGSARALRRSLKPSPLPQPGTPGLHSWWRPRSIVSSTGRSTISRRRWSPLDSTASARSGSRWRSNGRSAWSFPLPT